MASAAPQKYFIGGAGAAWIGIFLSAAVALGVVGILFCVGVIPMNLKQLTAGQLTAGGVQISNGSITTGGIVNCNSLTATGDITGNSIQAQYALNVASGSPASGNYVADSVQIFNGVVNSQGEKTGFLNVGSISAGSLDASYAVSVGDTSKGSKSAGIMLYNGTVNANGGVNGAYQF